MSKYAQIIKNKVNLIVVEDDKVDELRNAGLTIIDVSEIDPKPQAGWLYDSDAKTFSEPEYVEVSSAKDSLTEIKEKLDFLASEIAAIKEQTKTI